MNCPIAGIKKNRLKILVWSRPTGRYLPNSWGTKERTQSKNSLSPGWVLLATNCWLKLQGNYNVSGKGHHLCKVSEKASTIIWNVLMEGGGALFQQFCNTGNPSYHTFLIYTDSWYTPHVSSNLFFPSPQIFNCSVPHLGDENLKPVVITSMRNFILKAF